MGHFNKDLFFRHVAQTSASPDGFEVSHAQGIYLYDQSGKAFIDCTSGIAVSSLGHQHPAIRNAILEQLDLYSHTTVYGEHVQAPQVRLATKLAQILPEKLHSTYFVNSGAEAVEGAIKLARKYTNRYEIIACRNAYHGSTAGAESLRSDLEHTKSIRPLVPGVRHIDFNSVADIEKINKHTAAIILEPIQGEAGVKLLAPNYLSAIQKRCQDVRALMILDEIQTGMGRTGSFCAFEQEGVVPDILLLAKAFGGGLPLGAFISSAEIMRALAQDPPLNHLTTFGGNPVCCAASLAAIEILFTENLFSKTKVFENRIKEKLTAQKTIKEVRGRGLMLAIELQDSNQLAPAIKACRENGLLVDWFLFNQNSIRLYPPLVISEDEVEVMCDKIVDAL